MSGDPRFHRRVQRYGWDLAVSSYDAGWVPVLGHFARGCVERAALRPGEHVLDVATGTGVAALHAAEQVGPTGRVVGIDISEKMTQAAAAAARAAGVSHAEFVRADMEQTGLPDASFDVVLCAFGLMYAADTAAALRELLRVLKPGGRLVACVWGRRDACGWRGVFEIVDARVDSDVCPMFFALGVPGALAARLEGCGFTAAEDERAALTIPYPDGATACEAVFAGGPVALAYSKFSPEARAEVHEEYLRSIAPHAREDGGYDVPGEIVFGKAYRAVT